MAKTVTPQTTMANSTPTHDEIAAQAYQIYLREGCVEGRDLDHWLQAEAELRGQATQGTERNGANGHSNVPFTNGTGAPQANSPQKPEQVLTNSVIPPTAPIAQVTRPTMSKKGSGKREAVAK